MLVDSEDAERSDDGVESSTELVSGLDRRW